jgi:aminopeptidase N
MKNLTKWSFSYTAMLLLFTFVLLSFCTDTRSQDKKFSNTSEEAVLDVSFYHLVLEIGLDKESDYYGKTTCQFSVSSPTNTIDLNLHSALKIEDIKDAKGNSLTYTRQENTLNIIFPQKIASNTQTTVQISYYGKPQTIEQNGIQKGFIYAHHGNYEPVIATLNTPFLSHYWFPCNEKISDKADSVYLDIIIPDTTINNYELMALANGKLEANLKLVNNKKIFKWRHRHAIAPCYIFFAISNYRKKTKKIKQEDGTYFPIDFYVFNEDYNESLLQMNEIKKVFTFFSNKFGAYPFGDEQIAFAQIGFYSGIETQTCPILENLTQRRFYTMIHELAHSWFANSVTAQTWQDAWLHEGFATYAEVLWDEYRYGKIAYQNSIQKRAYYEGGKIYGEPTTNPFQVFSGIVYNKGAYVLHLLRGVVGDDVFFDILTTYSARYQNKNASTIDFINICKEKSNYDFDTFFNQWIYGEGFPSYSYSFYQNPKSLEINFTIRQTQVAEVNQIFKMPIQLYLDLEFRDTIITINNQDYYEEYTFKTEQKINNIILDPNNWLLKKVEQKKHLIEISNNGIYDVIIDQSLSGRTLDLVIKSAKIKKVFFLLKNVENRTVYEKKLTVGGTAMVKIEIPRNIEGGAYTIIIESKSERFFKDLMILD